MSVFFSVQHAQSLTRFAQWKATCASAGGSWLRGLHPKKESPPKPENAKQATAGWCTANKTGFQVPTWRAAEHSTLSMCGPDTAGQ